MPLWKPCPEFEGLYAVSDEGEIKRLTSKKGAVAGKILRPTVRRNGYKEVVLRKEGRSHGRSIHRLVAMAFLGPPTEGQVVAHNNGNKLNNHAANLRWASPRENMRDCIKHGTHNRGARHYRTRLTEQDVIRIRNDGRLHREIAEDYSVAPATVTAIKNRRNWRHI